jgi:hypothetical protein
VFASYAAIVHPSFDLEPGIFGGSGALQLILICDQYRPYSEFWFSFFCGTEALW